MDGLQNILRSQKKTSCGLMIYFELKKCYLKTKRTFCGRENIALKIKPLELENINFHKNSFSILHIGKKASSHTNRMAELSLIMSQLFLIKGKTSKTFWFSWFTNHNCNHNCLSIWKTIFFSNKKKKQTIKRLKLNFE